MYVTQRKDHLQLKHQGNLMGCHHGRKKGNITLVGFFWFFSAFFIWESGKHAQGFMELSFHGSHLNRLQWLGLSHVNWGPGIQSQSLIWVSGTQVL